MTKLLLIVFTVFYSLSPAQTQPVSGRVTSLSERNGIPGVNIVVKGTSRGSITDIDGRFTITLEPGETIVASSVGYKISEVRFENQSSLNIVLEEDQKILDEVVITGYKEVERKLFTGAATNIKMSDIKSPGMSDAGRMLEGRVAGVTVDNVSGTFGTSPKIRIRGNTSINGDTQPLMVVDGVILEDLNAVSANDIITGNANTLTTSSI